MSSIREMLARIQTVENIGQLTRALQAISASQVRRSKELAEDSRPYIQYAGQIMRDMINEPEYKFDFAPFQPLDRTRDALIVLISSDRGLAGSYTSNVFRELNKLEQTIHVPKKYISVGKKGREMLLRRKKKIVADFSEVSTATNFHQLKTLSEIILGDFEEKQYGQVHLVYTEYWNMVRLVPTARRLLPIDINSIKALPDLNPPSYRGGCLYEGDPITIINSLLSRYIRMLLFHAVTASKTSEHTARMLAMNTATENTQNIIADLQLEYNKIRQQTITNSILDIMGGTVDTNSQRSSSSNAQNSLSTE